MKVTTQSNDHGGTHVTTKPRQMRRSTRLFQQKAFAFDTLLSEMRKKIYKLVLQRSTPITFRCRRPHQTIGCLRALTQVFRPFRQETLGLFMAINTFEVRLSANYTRDEIFGWQECLEDTALSNIRHLHVKTSLPIELIPPVSDLRFCSPWDLGRSTVGWTTLKLDLSSGSNLVEISTPEYKFYNWGVRSLVSRRLWPANETCVRKIVNALFNPKGERQIDRKTITALFEVLCPEILDLVAAGRGDEDEIRQRLLDTTPKDE